MQSRPILWSFRRCPYAMRARLALKSAGITVELREILLRDKPDAFLAVSKNATVPALELTDGRILEESRDIMVWALQQSGDPQGWLSGWPACKDDTVIFLDQLDKGFKTDLDRYKYAARSATDKHHAAEIARTHRDSGAVFLDAIEARLAQQPFLGGGSGGLEDFSALPFIRQFRGTDTAWFDQQDWPSIHSWLQTFLNSAAFAAIMDKYPPWQPEDAPILF